MTQLAALVRKDVLRFMADRSGAVLTVVIPVMLAGLLGMLFAPSDGARSIRLLVVDQEDTEATRALVAAIDAEDALTVERATLVDARLRLQQGKASVALVLPPGTSRSLEPRALFGGARTDAPLLYDPSDETEAQIARGLLYRVSMEQVAKALSDPAQLRRMFDDLITLVEAESGDSPFTTFLRAGAQWAGSAAPDGPGPDDAGAALRPPITLVSEPISAAGPAAGYNSFAHNFAGMLCMFLLFFGVEAAKELAHERDSGVQTRLQFAPVSRARIFLARGISTALIALLISIAIYAAGMGVFGVRVHGPWLGFIAVILSVCVLTGGFALLLAGLAPTVRQIASIGGFVVLLASFAGGAMFPSFMMPGWLQQAAMALPTFWATDGLAAMTWRGLDLAAGLVPAAILTGFGVAFGWVGAQRYRWSA